MGFLSRLRGSASLTPAAAAAGAADGTLVLVDVREPDEFAAGHDPHARPIPLDRLAPALKDLAKEGKPIAFVCRSGARSARATSQAQAAGIDAHNVTGGMMAWPRHQLPIATGTAKRPRR
jgi:rhodanese-related sulfurtransferase